MNILEQSAKVLAEIDEQLAICEKATAGPWMVDPRNNGNTDIVYRNPFSKDSAMGIVVGESHQDIDDATFIASARTVCPKSLRCLKTAMNVFLSDKQWNEQTTSYELRHDSLVALSAIITQWNENK